MMARNSRNLNLKKAIYVFWEGESEEAYVKFLHKQFQEKAVIKYHREKGTFATARAWYRSNTKFRNNFDELDELWFFFDTEIEKAGKWDENWSCLDQMLQSRPKRNPLIIRLLMTSCCVEYWFLLHFERAAPAMASPSDKERILQRVKEHIPSYRKGDELTTAKIGEHYLTAVENGNWILQLLKADGMPDNVEDRDKWLFQGTHTFTTVHEAIEMLMDLPSLP